MSAPVITEAPRNQTVTVGDNVTLNCRFHSEIEAYVDWFKLHDDVIATHSSDQSQLGAALIQVWFMFSPFNEACSSQ